MSPQAVGVGGMLVLLLLIFLRVPIAVAMGLVGVVGYAMVNGWSAALTILGQAPFDMSSSYIFSQLPLFLLMGDLAMKSGMSARAFVAAREVFAGVRGSQAFAAVGAAAAFGSVSGSSVATAATITRVAVPEMRRAGYDDRLSTGVCAAGGSLGILIPPSIPLVIYGLIAEQSVPKLYAAAMIPGLLLTLMYMLCVIPVMKLKPHWVPGSHEKLSFIKRVRALAKLWDLALLLVVVIGGMYAGWFTATEAAAMGAFGAWLLGFVQRQLTWRAVMEGIGDTIRTTCMLFAIVFSAVVFTYFVVLTQLPALVGDWAKTLNVSGTALMLLMMAFYVVLGCFMEAFGMLLITVPVFLPLVVQSGFDPIWFGVMLVLAIELGLIHPPLGMNIFVMQAQLPDIPLVRLYQGIVPFLAAPILLIVVLVFVPQIAMALPDFLFPAVRR